MFGLPTDTNESEMKGLGEFFLLACYGFILYRAAVLIGDGSEKLLLIYGPGLIGGLVIPILGAVPDGAIVLVSGLGADAQCQVSVGVGTLAGSTIMLLTIPWALSIFLGYRDKDPNTGEAAVYPGTTKPKRENKLSLTDSVITTFSNTPFGAKIMMATSVSYLIVAIPAIIYKGQSEDKQDKIEHIPSLIGMLVCAIAFIAYAIYQVYDSHATTQQEMAQQKLKFFKWRRDIGRKFGNTTNATRAVFERFDKDNNGTIDRQELRDGFAALGLNCSRQQVINIMESMNLDENADTLTFDEFGKAIKTWGRVLVSTTDVTTGRSGLTPAMTSSRRISLQNTPTPLSDNANQNNNNNNNNNDENDNKTTTSEQLVSGNDPNNTDNNNNNNNMTTNVSGGGSVQSDNSSQALLQNRQKSYHTEINVVDENETIDMADDKAHLLDNLWAELEDEEEDEELLLDMSNQQLLAVALAQLLFGTILVTIFSDPMVAVIENFSTTINVSAFFVSFVVTPLASNASEIYSALVFAAKKSTEGISLGFSALYGAACMNNTFVLCIFCALIYIKNLEWTFLVETLVILLTIIVVGIIGLSKTIEVWKGIVVMAMFPISILLVAALESVMDDDNANC